MPGRAWTSPAIPCRKVPAIPSADKAKDTTDKDAIRADITALNEEVELFKQATAEKKKELDDLLAHHQISTTHRLAQSVAAFNQEKEDITDMYADEFAVADISKSQRADIEKQLATQLKAIANQIKDDQRKAADATIQE